MFDLINRANLPQAVEQEFEHLIGAIRGVFLKEHNEDGTHFIRPEGFDFVPVGMIAMWPTNTAPTGSVLCRGQQLSRVDYATLFGVIGTTYGVGDGSTTFNAPDLQGRFALGKASSGTGASLADTGGAIDHTHTSGSSGSHTHTATTAADGDHNHGGSTGSEGSHTHPAGSISSNVVADFASTPAYWTGGGPSAQPFHIDSSGSDTGAGSAHSHSISGSGNHTHTISVSTDGAHTHTSGSANPPYLVVNYIIFTGRA